MAVFSGPTIVDNGLVFHYDMSNTQKSWKGAPTTNRCANGEGFYTSGVLPTYWAFEQAFGGISPTGQTSGTDAYGYGYFQFSIVGTTTVTNRLLISPVYYGNSEAAVTAGTTYTFSYNVDNVSNYGYGIQATYLWYDSANTFLSVSYGASYSSVSSWSRKTDTVTAPANAAKVSTRFDFIGYSTVGTVLNFTLRLGGIQWEVSSFQTPYVKTTSGTASRTNTQVLLDLANQNTITATSLTYDSNNTFSFTGTNSISIPSINFSQAQTIEIWLQPLENDATRRNPYNQSFGGYGTWTHESSGVFNYYYGDAGANTTPYIGHSSSFTVVQNEIAHLVSTRNTTTSWWYKNGVQNTSYSHSYLDLTTDSNPIYIGSGYAGGYIGNIFSVKLYNRALTATEIRQNFEASRGRYGI